ncbi:MAG: DUF3108 domain-containing protein [Caldimonas sp.]
MARRLSHLGSALPGRMRGARFVALVLAVTLVHSCVTHELAKRMEGFATAARMPPRIEVAYVRTLEPEAPPAIAPAAPPPLPRRRAARSAKAASAAQPVGAAASAASAPEVAKKAAEHAAVVAAAASAAADAEAKALAAQAASDRVAAQAAADAATARAASDAAIAQAALDAATARAAAAATAVQSESEVTIEDRAEAMASAVSAAARAAAAASAASSSRALRASSAGAASAATAEPFDWPASTRVSFVLTGNDRGEVNGSAQVEWIRVGTHYQVNLDLRVGPEFAPIITRRMTSAGELTAEGLVPSRYDEDTQVVFRDRRRVSVIFQPDGVVLANGERRERWPGLQDTASQFIQLTWLFTMHPERLHVGGTVEMPLALPRKVDRWTYDVLDETVIYTPFGPLPTVHLKPRRDVPRPGELSAEIWFAPQLRYLPVRIRIEQDPETWLDLVIARKPELAGR